MPLLSCPRFQLGNRSPFIQQQPTSRITWPRKREYDCESRMLATKRDRVGGQTPRGPRGCHRYCYTPRIARAAIETLINCCTLPYTCPYTPIHLYTQMYAFIYVYIYIYCLHPLAHACRYACMPVCYVICVSMYACARVCICKRALHIRQQPNAGHKRVQTLPPHFHASNGPLSHILVDENGGDGGGGGGAAGSLSERGGCVFSARS
jgi:hypothetical protein